MLRNAQVYSLTNILCCDKNSTKMSFDYNYLDLSSYLNAFTLMLIRKNGSFRLYITTITLVVLVGIILPLRENTVVAGLTKFPLWNTN